MANILEMGPRVPKNDPNTNTMTGSIMTILKTCLAAISSISVNFDKLDEKLPLLIVRVILPILDVYTIFKKVRHLLIKFDEKHDGEVTKPQDRPNLCAKMMLRSPKNDPRSIFTMNAIRRFQKQP